MEHNLTYERIMRLHRALTRKYAGDPNLISIGYGYARKDGQIDEERGLAVCFHVAKKKKRPRTGEKFDPHVTYQSRSDREKGPLKLRTDVIQRPRVVASGRNLKVELSTSIRLATCGLLIHWQETDGNNIEDRKAFVTVGHVFRSVNLGQIVKLAGSDGAFKVFGRLLAIAPRNSFRDVALVEVTDFSLTALAPPISTSVTIPDADTVIAALGKPGMILNNQGTPSFIYGMFHPSFPDIENLGKVNDVLEAMSAPDLSFRVGTSGAAWMLGNTSQGQVACLQTAGFENENFRHGLGQLSFRLMDWVNKVLATPNLVPGSLRFEAVY